MAKTDVSIEATCSPSCPFKSNGCYVREGFTRFAADRLDAAARGYTGEEVIAAEVEAIDGAFHGAAIPQDGALGGRDLRLHVGGDVFNARSARLLARASERWQERGGGSVWTYTHAWRTVPRSAWGRHISVLASVEHVDDIARANARGYAAAIVLSAFDSRRALRLTASRGRVVPCPAETGTTTCVECRLCLDRDLLGLGITIGFAAHGNGASRVRDRLVGLRRSRSGGVVTGEVDACRRAS